MTLPTDRARGQHRSIVGTQKRDHHWVSSQRKLQLFELEADLIISAFPGCPRWASRRVDVLTIAIDCLLDREVTL